MNIYSSLFILRRVIFFLVETDFCLLLLLMKLINGILFEEVWLIFYYY